MNPRYKFQLLEPKLSPSQGMAYTVYVKLQTVTEEIHIDPVTGIKTLIEPSTPDSSSLPVSFYFSIDSSTRLSHISDHLFVRITNDRWFCDCVAKRIASDAKKLGFGIGFDIVLVVTQTYQRVVSVASESVLQKLVRQGTIDGEELKTSKIETESCSICLENLSGSKTGVPTRMPCSHVFHGRCLLEWLCRKDTCPVCRRVLSQ